MKNLMTTIFIAIFGAIAFSACSKDSTEPDPTNNNGNNTSSPYVLTATISGASFKGDTCGFYFSNLLDTTKGEVYSYPSTGPNTYPQIFLYAISGVGTYALAPGDAQLMKSSSAGEYCSSGSVTVTSLYPSVVGTFYFTTNAGTAVTNGSFNARRK
jgi:hypothetical protein